MGSLVEWAVAARTVHGESVSGDQYLVKPFPHGVLVAVVDGLGHGKDAQAAAAVAVATMETCASDPPSILIQKCHAQLCETRGAAITIASIDALERKVRWLGVGNVEGVIVHGGAQAKPAQSQLTLRGGVVGYRLPSLRESAVLIQPEDLLLLATDGIRIEFLEGIPSRGSAQDIADELLARFGKRSDDGLVLAARWKG
jgi:negative regulator of sigma-B (phosphoserine phosphatase)